MQRGQKKELIVLSFSSPKKFETWLKQHHAKAPGIWMQIFKKHSGVKSITYAEALDVALCYGWIDSQKKSHDTTSFLQKFTPRRQNSVWSKVNREHIERLTKEGRMKASGMAAVELAKKDGRWEQAYDSARTMTLPEDFLVRLKKNQSAYTFFKTLSKTNLYAIAWRLQTAKKPGTREKRMLAILAMLENKQTFH